MEAKFNDGVTFQNATFKEIIVLSSTETVGIFNGWNSIKNNISCDETTYLNLIKNFKDHGLFNDADQCYFKYRCEYISSPLDWFGWITCGFGVRLDFIIGWSIIIIISFAILYWNTNSVYKLTNSRRALKFQRFRNLSFNDALFFSSLVFFTLHPPPDWEYSGNWRYWVLLEDILGGAFIALFIVVLGNLVIR